MKVLLSLFILLGVCNGHAAVDDKPQTTKARGILRKNFYQVSAGYRIWHEDVSVTSAGVPGDIPMQFHGFELGGSYQVPMRNFRWVKYYGADFSFGVAKGAGQGPVVDSLKDQPWMALTVKPGLIYRATAVSEIGLYLPIAYRKVSWKLDETAQLVLNDKSFSVGLGAMFINRFTPYSSLLITVTHQHMWTSTVWGIAWQYDFK